MSVPAEPSANESLYHAMVEAASTAMVLVDREGRIALVNAQAERMFGTVRGELIGKPIETLVPERYRGGHPGARGGFFATPKARAMGIGRDLYARRLDGSEFPVEVGLSPIETAEGTLVLASIVDITERKRLESHFQQVVESVPNGIIMVNREGRITLANAQAEHLFGASRSELIGQPVEALLPERYRASHPGSRAGFFATPKTRAIGSGRDLYARRLDGSEFPVEIGLSPIEAAEGTLVLASIIDITQRKRAEQALRESEEGFQLLVNGVKDYAIFMLDTDGRVMSWNKGAEAIKGYRAEEVLAQPFSIFFTEEDKRAGSPEEHLRIAMELGSHEEEVVRVRKGGRQFWANVVLTALRDEHGRLQGYAKVTRDITERKLSQESMMARALEEKTTLLNEVHHRVKNNLQVISSLFNLQAAHTHDDGVRQVLSESQGRVRAMALIHQLLYESHDFSRIHLGDYLARLGQLLVTLHSAKANRIALRVEASGGPVCLDLHRAVPCGLLVTELATNAFKHAFPAGSGEVHITLARLGAEEAMLAVADTGVGLPAGFQLGRTATLGLRLVQRLAEQVNGRLVVGDGPGTAFFLYFKPLIDSEKT